MTKELFLYGGMIWSVIAMALLLFAWRAARQGNKRQHQVIMVFLTLAAWGFIVIYLMGYGNKDAVPSIPAKYIPWIALHGSIALIPLIGATVLVISRFREKRKKRDSQSHLQKYHKIYGRVFIFLWLFTHVGGIINAFLFG